MKKQTYDLEERLLEYSVSIIKIVEQLPKTRVGNHVAGQLLKSGTSPYPNHIGCLFFHSMLDVRCSMFDVHLANQARVVGQALLGNFYTVLLWYHTHQFRACKKDPEAAPILIDKSCE
jgi:hypothetical protein